MNRWTEKTEITRKNILVIGLAVAVLAFLIAAALFRWTHGGAVTPLEIGSLLIIALVLLERALGRYEYEADGKELRIVKKGLLGRHVYEVSYGQIIGIYRYKAKLVGYIKFRRTHRLHSALDGRTVWVIAYRVTPVGKKEYNERIYFKPGAKMLEFLTAKLPGKVKVPETQVVVEALRDQP